MKTNPLSGVSRVAWTLALLSFVLIFTSAEAGTAAITTLFVDATEAPRNILHVEETIPVQAGALSLFYPKWIPGEHGPTGPLIDLVGLRINANGIPVAWRRDAVEMHAIKLQVPVGTSQLELHFDFVLPPITSGFSSGSSSTTRLVVVNWNQVVLYPLAAKPDDFMIASQLKLPVGWKHATELRATGQTDATVRFTPVSLTMLVDSPVLAGDHFTRTELTPAGDKTPVFLNLAADSEAALAIPPEVLAAYRRLVVEARALFGATHYGRYEFLYTLSDHVAHFGLEHHESSDNRWSERTLIDEDQRRVIADLLPHEHTHSLNGKFRRPTGLATGDFSTPYNDELLWVYEGMTQYLGELLTVRPGLSTADEFRAALAQTAAIYGARPGRTWRPLQDTADAAQLLYYARADYGALRRSSDDFYYESLLIWLEVDVTLRELTGGVKSLDDFCRAFFGGPSGPPALKPYTADDVFAALNAVAPHDWRALLTDRLQSLRPTAPLGGIERAGWRLVFKDTPTTYFKSHETVDKQTDARFSLGLLINADGNDAGTLVDVIPGTPAAQASLAPGMKLIAVNGRKYSADILKAALKEGITANAPLELLAENREFFSTHRVEYHGGEKYPWLERDPAKPDVLAKIIAPLVPESTAPTPSPPAKP
jgi:predicted metalloprotease with PDZ domain